MEKQTAGRDNLGKLAPEFAELNDDVLFGEDFFQSFSAIVQSNAASREKGDVVDYNQALDILKKKVSSKYSIRLLMQALGKRNKGNDSNIEYLCQIMDETKSWHLVKDFVPQLNEKAISGKDSQTSSPMDYIKLDSTPMPNLEKSQIRKPDCR